MRINEMTLTQPIYNPEVGAFEAEARLFEAGAVFSYRVSHVSAPHAEFDAVTRGLKGHALMQHRHSKERTQRLIRDTVRAATSRANSPVVGTFLAA
ncbi:MAG: hypothetical protein AAFQ05_11080 [Pseudomonadota bacterium]